MTTINNQLTSLALIKISGEDAANFLQGQLTNDVHLAVNGWQYSGYCSPKGRLTALLRLWQHDDTVWAVIDSETMEAAVNRLRMYVMRSKVTIEHVAAARIDAVFLGDPNELLKETSDQAFTMNHLSIINDKFVLGFGARALIVEIRDPSKVPIETQTDTEPNKASEADQRWLANDISAGFPSLNSATTELFVPQMVNLDLLGGINFKKGCYTGQEIVARLHYLGKLKQRMIVCELDQTGTSVSAACKLVNQAGKTVGNALTDSAIYNGKSVFLAVMRLENRHDRISTAKDNWSVSVSLTQPYQLDSP